MKKSVTKILASAALLSAACVSQAKPFFNVDGGVGMHFPAAAGNIAGVDITDELGLEKDDSGLYVWGSLRTLPFLPGLKVRHQKLALAGNKEMAAADLASLTNFGDVDTSALTGTVNIASNFDMTYTDYIATYGIGLPFVRVEAGVDLRVTNLGYGFSADGDSIGEGSATIPLPMGYLAAHVTIPATGVTVMGELATLPIEGASVSDIDVKAIYYVPLPTDLLVKVGLEAGYRQYTIDLSADAALDAVADFASSLEYKGVYVGATASF